MEETKNTRKEWDKTYRAKHKEQIQKYRDDNKDAQKEYNKEYKEDHKAQIQKYKEEHKDQIKQYYTDYNKLKYNVIDVALQFVRGIYQFTRRCFNLR